MNFKELFKHYYSKLKKEAVIKSLICGLLTGFGVALMTAVIQLITQTPVWGYAIGIGLAAASGTAPAFFFLKFKPDVKDVARRIDGLGLEERAITMVECAEVEGFMAEIQREDAKDKISKANKKAMRFSGLGRPLTALIVAAVLATAAVTGTALTIQRDTQAAAKDDETGENGRQEGQEEIDKTVDDMLDGLKKYLEDNKDWLIEYGYEDLYNALKCKIGALEDTLNTLNNNADKKAAVEQARKEIVSAITGAQEEIISGMISGLYSIVAEAKSSGKIDAEFAGVLSGVIGALEDRLPGIPKMKDKIKEIEKTKQLILDLINQKIDEIIDEDFIDGLIKIVEDSDADDAVKEDVIGKLEEIKGLDDVGDKLAAIDDIIAELREKGEDELADALLEALAEIRNLQDVAKEIEDTVNKAGNDLENLENIKDGASGAMKDAENALKTDDEKAAGEIAQDKIKEIEDAINNSQISGEAKKELLDKLGELGDAVKDAGNIGDILGAIDEFAKDTGKILDGEAGKNDDEQQKISDALKNQGNEFADKLGQAVTDEQNGNENSVNLALDRILDELKQLEGDELAEAIENLAVAIRNALEDADADNALADALSGFAGRLDEIAAELRETGDTEKAIEDLEELFGETAEAVENAVNPAEKLENELKDIINNAKEGLEALNPDKGDDKPFEGGSGDEDKENPGYDYDFDIGDGLLSENVIDGETGYVGIFESEGFLAAYLESLKNGAQLPPELLKILQKYFDTINII